MKNITMKEFDFFHIIIWNDELLIKGIGLTEYLNKDNIIFYPTEKHNNKLTKKPVNVLIISTNDLKFDYFNKIHYTKFNKVFNRREKVLSLYSYIEKSKILNLKQFIEKEDKIMVYGSELKNNNFEEGILMGNKNKKINDILNTIKWK